MTLQRHSFKVRRATEEGEGVLTGRPHSLAQPHLLSTYYVLALLQALGIEKMLVWLSPPLWR